MTNINIELAETVISQKKAQGQTIAVLSNHELSVSADKIYTSENLEQIKLDQPDFLIIFADEENLLAQTEFIYDWGGKHALIGEEVAYKSRAIASRIVNLDTKKKLVFKKLAQKISYPDDYAQKVSSYWDYLLAHGRAYWDGLMFSVCGVRESADELRFEFAQTNYRHFTYSKDHDFRNAHHTCTTASIALLETSDGYAVLGKMNAASVFSGQVKCLGGTLDAADFDGDTVNFERMFSREIFEELGIDISDNAVCASNEPRWLLIREQMAFVGLCNVIKLKLTKADLLDIFKQKRRDSEDEKEVERLVFIKSMLELDAFAQNEKADYVDALYRCYFGLETGLTWAEFQKNRDRAHL